MPKFHAKKNLTIGIPGKKHVHVKKGDHFDCDADYFEEHLAPHGLAEDSSKAKAKDEAKAEDSDSESKKSSKK